MSENWHNFLTPSVCFFLFFFLFLAGFARQHSIINNRIWCLTIRKRIIIIGINKEREAWEMGRKQPFQLVVFHASLKRPSSERSVKQSRLISFRFSILQKDFFTSRLDHHFHSPDFIPHLVNRFTCSPRLDSIDWLKLAVYFFLFITTGLAIRISSISL